MTSDLDVGFTLEGKVALITGGGGGFGRMCSRLFCTMGASVVVADLSETRMEETLDAIREAGGSAAAVRTDVSRESDLKQAVEFATERFGGLDIMVNNAGVALSPDHALEDTTEADWNRVIDVNLKGVFFGCKHAAAAMKRRGSGSIVNVSSGASLVAYPGIPVYTASKGGVNALTRALALDLGRFNIRVNAICPSGGMSANMMLPFDAPQVDEGSLWRDWNPSEFYVPLWRPDPPRMIDHARVVAFLASPASGFLTGLNLPSDGGMSIKGAIDMGRLLSNWASGNEGDD